MMRQTRAPNRFIYIVCALCLIGYSPVFGSEIIGRSVDGSKPGTELNRYRDSANVSQARNPHWTEECMACHMSNSGAGVDNLKNPDTDHLCLECHDMGVAGEYHHPVQIKPKESTAFAKLPPEFRSKMGDSKLLTCLTCHDVLAQCLKTRSKEKLYNPKFLRGGPYRDRTGICFQCHDQGEYMRLNAHDQISENGKQRKNICAICHDISVLSKKQTEGVFTSFSHRKDMVWICASCHPLVPHPSGGFNFVEKGTPNHLVEPSEEMLVNINIKAEKNGITMPLDPNTGRIYCATCHNPHEKGVIEDDKLSRGADEEKRLRMKNICLVCHDK